MLTHLTIKELAIIESLDIAFDDGLNVITGETGAGKSILIKAMNLLLGSKASAETVRKGSAQATVVGQFSFKPQHPVVAMIEKLGITIEDSTDDDFEMMIRRTITAKGKSSAWINDIPVTISSLKDVGSHLIDIMSQFENHKLLDPSQHLLYVNQFLKDKTALQEFSDAFDRTHESVEELRIFLESLSENVKNRDYLEFRLKELESFDPSVENFTEVQDFFERSKKSRSVIDSLNAARTIVDEGYQGASIAKSFSDIGRLLRSAKLDDGDRMEIQLSELIQKTEDLSFEIGKLTDAFDLDETEIKKNEARLSDYFDLMRKFGVKQSDELVAEYARLQAAAESLNDSSTYISKMLTKITEQSTALRAAAQKLTKLRKKAAEFIESAVVQELKDLAMPQAAMKVDFSPIQKREMAFDATLFDAKINAAWKDVQNTLMAINSSGQEDAQFFLKTNAGEPFHPLQKIASGGEVSRLMLALKKALISGGDTCILVFDEIDTGISGKVADVVGKKLKTLAKDFQVICISHLPQVAAYADKHFRVEKSTKGTRTESTIKPLGSKEQIEELARLLSGNTVTKSSLENAQALKQQADL